MDLYLGPYEHWNFGAGKDYTFPLIRTDAAYLTAIAEFVPVSNGGNGPSFAGGSTTGDPAASAQLGPFWFPTLWTRQIAALDFWPFVISNPDGEGIRVEDITVEQLPNLFGDFSARLQHVQELAATAVLPTRTGIAEERFRVAFPVPSEAMHTGAFRSVAQSRWTADRDLRARIPGRRVTVIAIIDDGIPFAHRNFRNADGTRTRIECCWLQSASVDPVLTPPVRFGREFVRDDIDRLIREHGADEDDLYRAAKATVDTEGYGAMINRHMSHGAHVMDLATGFDPERGEEPPEDVRIIAVQLPNTIAWDTSSFGKDMYMLSAFHYIFERADEIARAYGEDDANGRNGLRLVVNFSYGFSGGRHDGESELEAAIAQMVGLRRKHVGPTALVLPAGNTFLDRMHARIDRLTEGKAVLPWRIQPNDRTSSYLEIWFGKETVAANFTVDVFAPDGSLLCTTAVTAQWNGNGSDPLKPLPINDKAERNVGQLSIDKHRLGRWRVLVALAPTEPEMPGSAAAAAGLWRVVIRRTNGGDALAEPIRCWIQRDADPESLRSGSRQSYFDDSANVRFNADGSPAETDSDGSVVKRFGSLNGLATAPSTIVAGGYRLGAAEEWSENSPLPARYSSAGPKDGAPWPSRQVDCASMSDRSHVLPGTIAAGTRSGALSFVQGTSAAAPIVARKLAEAFRNANDAAVHAAEPTNYLDLPGDQAGRPGKPSNAGRLGQVSFPPHRQPGLPVG